MGTLISNTLANKYIYIFFFNSATHILCYPHVEQGICIKEDVNNFDGTSFQNLVIILPHINEYFNVLSCASHFKICQ